MTSLINLQALDQATPKTEPFPYFVIDRALAPEAVQEIIADFPDINQGGSFNLDDTQSGEQFQRLIEHLDTEEFRQVIGEKFDVNLAGLPMMITLRGFSRKKDGRIHTDSKTKLVTILIYLNEDWSAETGRLRILRNGTDMNDYVEEVVPGPGTLLAFKVTDNCWHGYPSFEGKRQSIQINFLTGDGANKKHQFFHGLSAKLKKLKG